jgi:hypothetical protein
MKESAEQNQEARLSYHGARRIVWLIFLLVIAWFDREAAALVDGKN